MACSLGKVQSTRQCLPAGSFPSRQDIRLSLNRDFSTERKELPQNEKLSGLQIFVQEANDVAEKSIVKLFACLITAEVVNIFGMKYLIVLLVPADSISFSLNVAYLIFHIPPFRYARYPLNLLFTWGIAKAAPALTQLKLFSKLSSWKASLPQSTKASSISPALNWTTKQLNQYG